MNLLSFYVSISIALIGIIISLLINKKKTKNILASIVFIILIGVGLNAISKASILKKQYNENIKNTSSITPMIKSITSSHFIVSLKKTEPANIIILVFLLLLLTAISILIIKYVTYFASLKKSVYYTRYTVESEKNKSRKEFAEVFTIFFVLLGFTIYQSNVIWLIF